MVKRTTALVMGLVLAASGCGRGDPPIVVGAVYPLSGTQGPGGIEEHQGVMLAAEMVNDAGGIQGRPVEVRSVDVGGSDAAPGAVDQLADAGVSFVLGSYGSTISLPAAEEAARRGMLFWETGAVGAMAADGAGTSIFRVSPTGADLGRSAIDFVVDVLAPRLGRDPRSLRYAVAYVDDVYGQPVASGATAEIMARGLPDAGAFPYDPRDPRPAETVRAIAEARPDVLFVSAYLDDGVALREEMIRQHLPLVASIGTSSSYCMLAFGARLGPDAVGLFASDKPDGDSLEPAMLLPDAATVLEAARARYRDEYGVSMTAPALAGFAGAWGLFRYVMPAARSMDVVGVSAAARAVRLPMGTLPNGSGLAFGPPGGPAAGTNLRAATVIWEWTGVNERRVVWPPTLATADVIPLVPAA